MAVLGTSQHNDHKKSVVNRIQPQDMDIIRTAGTKRYLPEKHENSVSWV